jgi:glycine/D-amino acid oxidase-like deaminating enzyme
MTGARRHRRLRSGKSLWLSRSPAGRRYPRLSGAHETRVAVVGGGMTGALIAEAFASAGIDVIVLEASLVGAGSTVASSALLMQEPDVGLAGLEERYGSRTSRRIWQLSRESVANLVARLTRLGVGCDLQPREVVYYAVDAVTEASLRREFTLRTRVGGTDEWLGPGELRRRTGIAGRGAILARGGAQLDPYRACAGVLAAAAAAGAQVYEQSAVRRIDAGPAQATLHTDHGSVTAERVVIATGYATDRFRPLAGRFRMCRTYVMVTGPMSATERRDLGLSDVMVWDTHRPYHYARWTADHRLLLGGADRPVRAGQRRDQTFDTALRELRDHFETVWPALSAHETMCAWEGLFALTPDSLPYIGPHRRYRRHWFALGYGGNGLTFANLAARLLLERWHDGESSDQALFAFGRF